MDNMLNIVQAPNPVLSDKAKKINRIDKKIHKLISRMTTTLINTTNPEGVGLAAPQVGESLRLFIIKESPKAPLRVFINPVIISKSDEKYPVSDDYQEDTAKPKKRKKAKKDNDEKEQRGVKLEGCLSLKDIWGIVHRSAIVTLAYEDEKGVRQERTFTGFLATIIQHECDHLEGILFPKRVLEQNEKLYKTATDEDGETVFEELEI